MTNKKYDKYIDKINPAKIYSSHVYTKTKEYQKKYGFGIGTGVHDTWNNEADAFKHAFGSADMALKSYIGMSKTIGDRHEQDGRDKMGQSDGEENMDKWNNQQGRQIAQKITKQIKNPLVLKKLSYSGQLDDMIAEEVMKKMRQGDLITHPDDKRKYKETPKKDKKTISQKFDAMLRADYNRQKNAKLEKIFGKPKTNKSSSTGNGRWVTINGAHVFIEN